MAAGPLSREEDQDAGGDLLHKRKQQAAKPSLALAAVLYDTDCWLQQELMSHSLPRSMQFV
jgi:hypothetical protein